MDGSTATDSIEQFDAEYPEELPDQLEWLEGHLRTSRWHLLRLMGLSAAEAAAMDRESWPEITQRLALQAELLEHRLTHYLSYFRYDSEEAVRFAARFSDRLRDGELDLEQLIPGYRADAARTEQEDALIAATLERPTLLSAVAGFLSRVASHE